ncbi:glycosyltransferase family 4 protein [Proteiniclasticum sp. SCR006]|uniref:Glycosyltransferase family 4 protein n=1 Tax=Proteiniclasticum aestuarii TaxID=2817862 RepID=A0A939KJS7_9CLOT|nr:glycosyltransferase family 4 protein [Proteiniclasticum aestuarii]MBO1264000.1 glycosyltransferase family 4 protein [Proteiniclasticum aestuarii]
MRILVVGQVFYPDNFRINDIVKELSLNHEVHVVTGLPDYERGYIPDEYKWFRNRNEKFYNATVHRVPMIARRTGAIFRSLNYVSYMMNSSFYTFNLKKKYDVVFCYQTSPITMFVPGLVYAKKNKVKTVLYSTDLWPESVKAMNIKENTIFYRIITNLSRRIYKAADKILVSSPSFKNYIKDLHGIDISTIGYLPQYTDEEVVSENELHYQGIKEVMEFTFAGNIGIVQDVDVLLHATAELVKKGYNLKVNIVGSGTSLSKMIELSEKLKLNEFVDFHGRKTHYELNDIYKNTDVCVLTLKDLGFIGKTIPSKLQTYFAKGKPVVAATSGDSQYIIKDSNAGFCVESGNISGLADIMEKYILNRKLLTAHSENALMYYNRNFSRDKFFRELYSYLEGQNV